MAISCCEIFSVIFSYSFDTSVISKRLTKCFYCFFVVFNFLFFCNVGCFSSARSFYDILQWSLKILTSSSVTILSFSVNIISMFSRKPLFVRNGLSNFQIFISLDTGFVTILNYTLIVFRRRDTHFFVFYVLPYVLHWDSYCIYSLIWFQCIFFSLVLQS